MSHITHNILGYNPFKVKFINHSTGTTRIEKYGVVLSKKEIEAEYDFIDFPPNRVQQVIDDQNENDLNALENQ